MNYDEYLEKVAEDLNEIPMWELKEIQDNFEAKILFEEQTQKQFEEDIATDLGLTKELYNDSI